MEKEKIIAVVSKYCPPLTISQVEDIATKVVELANVEKEKPESKNIPQEA